MTRTTTGTQCILHSSLYIYTYIHFRITFNVLFVAHILIKHTYINTTHINRSLVQHTTNKQAYINIYLHIIVSDLYRTLTSSSSIVAIFTRVGFIFRVAGELCVGFVGGPL